MATAVDRAGTLGAIRQAYQAHGYILDPHTAVGYAALQDFRDEIQGPVVLAATAHPAKFPEAVSEALPGVVPTHPRLDALAGLPERRHRIAASVAEVKALLAG